MIIPATWTRALSDARLAARLQALGAPDGWRVMFFIGETPVKGATLEEMTWECNREAGATPVESDTVSRKEYLAMARQRDAFRKAYEVLEAATKQAYRDVRALEVVLGPLSRGEAVDNERICEARYDAESAACRLLAAWNEAEEHADASGRPPRRRVPR